MSARIFDTLGLAAIEEKRVMRGTDLGFLSFNWSSVIAFDLVGAAPKIAILFGLFNTLLLFAIKGLELYFKIRELRRLK